MAKDGVKKVINGENSTREPWSGCKYGYHAETDAIRKLSKTKKRNTISLIVIRIDTHGLLKNSKPCANCVKSLSKITTHRIKNIYYSDQDGNIKKVKLSELINEKHKHISRGRRKREK